MRRYITTLLLIFACVASVLAQRNGNPQSPNGGGDPARSLTSFQSQQIVSMLKLEGERKERFEELYARYNEAERELMMLSGGGQRNRGGVSQDLTDEQIEESIMKSFEVAESSIELKKGYYLLYREFLSPAEISMVYDIERRTRDRFQSEAQRRTRDGEGERAER